MMDLENEAHGSRMTSGESDSLLSEWEDSELQIDRPVGTIEIIGPQEQNTTIRREFRTNFDIHEPLELRRDILSSVLVQKISECWPNFEIISEFSGSNDPNLQTIGESESAVAKSIVLIGVIEKKSSRPSTDLSSICKEIGMVALPIKKFFVSEMSAQDGLFISNKSASIRLTVQKESMLPYDETVSGVVCAVKGRINRKIFEVDEVIFPTAPEPIWPTVTKFHNIEMVFMSGLQIGKVAGNVVQRNLMLEYLQGMTGSPSEQENSIRWRTRAFIVGNIFDRKQRRADKTEDAMRDAKMVDDFISQLCDTMEVFLIPGENDLTSTPCLPQPPLHSMLFPRSKQMPNFRRLCNPAKVKVSVTDPEDGEDVILGGSDTDEKLYLILSSGKNITETMQQCEIKCPLKISRKLLQWSHMYPTNLETTPLYNGNCEQVFSMCDQLPHLFVIGNQEKFGVDKWNEVKIISVPDFETTCTIALLTYELNVVPLTFNVMF